MKPPLQPDRDFARETRSILLRFVALAVLIGNLVLVGDEGTALAHLVVVFSYLGISVASIATARILPGSGWLKTVFVVLDALLVALLLYAHILSGPVTENHNLTTSGLVVAFILLVQIGLKQDRRLVLVFSAIVLTSWVAMLAITAVRHAADDLVSLLASFLNQDLGLTVSFGFTAFAIYLLARDHDRTRREAMRADQRRLNLSRFFSPFVVTELQDHGQSFGLQRRNVAIMFVDLRDFTRFAETAAAPELAFVLGEYRQLVSRAIFDHGGTVDKFMGDGVMAVFGHPKPSHDDADRALACALELVDVLDKWRRDSGRNGLPALHAAIGLHYGSVVGGVLDSGCHSEFTVIGDTVNVAQRLEKMAKSLATSLVVSSDLMSGLHAPAPRAGWIRYPHAALYGRQERIDVWYLDPAAGGPADRSYDIGGLHTAIQRSTFQSAPRISDPGIA